MRSRSTPSSPCTPCSLIDVFFLWNPVDYPRWVITGWFVPLPPSIHQFHNNYTPTISVGMLVTGLLASFKTPAWRIPAWGAGFTAAVLGAASVVYPEQASSVGVLRGTLALLWGAVFIVAAEWQRRDRASDRDARVHLAAQAREARSADH